MSERAAAVVPVVERPDFVRPVTMHEAVVRPPADRRAADRPATGRRAAVAVPRAHQKRPVRFAQGAVVAVLAVAICGTMAANADARGGDTFDIGASHTARTAAKVAEARHGAVDLASDAVQVASAVQVEGSQASVDATQLAALATATKKLNDLIATVDPEAAATVAAQVASAAATAAPAPAPAAAAPITDPANANLVVAPPITTIPAEPTPEPSPTSSATSSTDPSADATADASSGSTDAADDSTIPTAVPTIPLTDVEDAATAQLREAVAAVAELTADVRESAEANRAAATAAADAAAQAAEAQAAADAAAQAAAAQAAAAAAVQRAAWKRSLLGFANGEIPDSALCGVSFDSSVRLRCDAAEQLDVLNTAYKAHFGTNLVVSDSYRSYDGQVSCVRTKGYLCATPGTSNHGNGIAVDLGGGIETFGTQQHTWMDANAGSLEWVHPSWAEPGGTKPEAWHWEYSG